MPHPPQDFSNHRRYYSIFHFLASPITGLFSVYMVVRAIREPTLMQMVESLWTLAIFAGIVSARVMALTVQNRVIRLEMRLRLREVLPPPLAARIRELSVRQLVALRFAGDGELPALVTRVLNGEFATPKEIKRAVTDWQPDFLRA